VKEVKGDIWELGVRGWIVIPTNGSITGRGENVMGAGLALDAKRMYPSLPARLAAQIVKGGNKVYIWGSLDPKMITFPTKRWWNELSTYDLIEQSLQQLLALGLTDVYLPKVGCGKGQLRWENDKNGKKWEGVRALLLHYLTSDNYTVVL